jgi:hypothetical protein
MIEQQTEITPAMRAILVDWLVEVVEEYKLSQQTLFLAVSYVDRILAKMLVMRSQLQLVGVSCLILASYVFRAPRFFLFLAPNVLRWTIDRTFALPSLLILTTHFCRNH